MPVAVGHPQEHLANHTNAGDVDTAVQSFAEHAVDHDPADGQTAGQEGFRTFLKTLASAFPDARIEPAHMVADDEHDCIAYTLTGNPEAAFQGIPATGKRIEVRGVQIGRFEGGQIVERWGSSDELGILKQIGAEPKSKGPIAKAADTLTSYLVRTASPAPTRRSALPFGG